MAEILELQNHLKSRPIAPIFDRLSELEKTDEVALKFMCLIDSEMTKANLYARINATNYPKLLYELLGFSSYKNFTYYSYRDNFEFGGKLLKCGYRQCEFVGQYMLTLTHMAVNHKMDVGSKMCLYCESDELKTHFDSNTFQACYDKYLQGSDISDALVEDTAVHQIISDFYRMLKECSQNLEVVCSRKLYRYVGKIFHQPEQLSRSHGNEISRRILVCRPKRVEKVFSINNLNEMFVKAMIRLHVKPTRLMQRAMDARSAFKFNVQPNAAARMVSASAPSTNEMKGTDPPQPDALEPFIRLLNDRFGKIKNKSTQRKLELSLLDTVRIAEEEDDQSQ